MGGLGIDRRLDGHELVQIDLAGVFREIAGFDA
jgi:hypothetical protein